MSTPERRHPVAQTMKQLRAKLNDAQLDMARELERFGWDLRFVRQRPFQPVVPVMYSCEETFLLLREDWTVDDAPQIELRQDKPR